MNGGDRKERSEANCGAKSQIYLSGLILIKESELNTAKWRYTVDTKEVI